MPVRAVCKPHSPDFKRGALATLASLVECPHPAPAFRVRDPLCDGADPGGYIGAVTRTGVRFRGVNVMDVCQ